MTVYQFLDQLFERPQQNVETNRRYITASQLELFERLIAEHKDAAAIARQLHGFTWSPEGDFRYVVTEDERGCRRSIAKELTARAAGQGSLF
jgi:hypothetical protein